MCNCVLTGSTLLCSNTNTLKNVFVWIIQNASPYITYISPTST